MGKPGRSLEAIILPGQQVISTDPTYVPWQVNCDGKGIGCSSKGKGMVCKSREDVKPEMEKSCCPDGLATGKAHNSTDEKEPSIAILRSSQIDVEGDKAKGKTPENTTVACTNKATVCEGASPLQKTVGISGGHEQRPKRWWGRKT